MSYYDSITLTDKLMKERNNHTENMRSLRIAGCCLLAGVSIFSYLIGVLSGTYFIDVDIINCDDENHTTSNNSY